MPLIDESLQLGRQSANITDAQIILTDVFDDLFIIEASTRSIKRHTKQRPLISTFGTIMLITRSILAGRPRFGSKGNFGNKPLFFRIIP